MGTDTEPEAMAQVHRIREKLYKETKNLSDDEILRRTKESARQLKDKYQLDIPARDIARR